MRRNKTCEAGSQWHMAEIRSTRLSKRHSPSFRRCRRVGLRLYERVVELCLEIGLALFDLIGNVLRPVDVAKWMLD